jgi:hypothetical protein
MIIEPRKMSLSKAFKFKGGDGVRSLQLGFSKTVWFTVYSRNEVLLPDTDTSSPDAEIGSSDTETSSPDTQTCCSPDTKSAARKRRPAFPTQRQALSILRI